MADPVIEASRKSLARTTPGNGAHNQDDGFPGTQHVRIRSIPHLPSERLERRAAYLSSVLFTVERLREFDGPRRALIHHGVHLQAITHEINLRKAQP